MSFVVHTLSITRRALLVKANSESDVMPRREIVSVNDKAEENRKFGDLLSGNSLLICRIGGRMKPGKMKKGVALKRGYSLPRVLTFSEKTLKSYCTQKR